MRYTVRQPFAGVSNRVSECRRRLLTRATCYIFLEEFRYERAAAHARIFSELETASSINENKAESNIESFKKIRDAIYNFYRSLFPTDFYEQHEIFITRIPFSPLRNSLFTKKFSAELCATFHVTKDNDCALFFFPGLNLTLKSNRKVGTAEKNGSKVRSAGEISEEKGRKDKDS